MLWRISRSSRWRRTRPWSRFHRQGRGGSPDCLPRRTRGCRSVLRWLRSAMTLDATLARLSARWRRLLRRQPGPPQAARRTGGARPGRLARHRPRGGQREWASAITRADVQRFGGAQEGAEPLRGVHRAMALRMAEAGKAVVPATLTDEADVAAWPAGTPVTARLIAALAAACKAEPALNVAYDGVAMARRLNAEVHVGVAVDTEDGLIVPVLRNAERRDLAALSVELTRLETEARARSIAPEALRGATISLSNFGSLAGQFAALVVVPPQVAILGAGRISPRVMAIDGAFVARPMLPLSLTFDHRAVSGGEAARFLSAVKTALEGAS